MRRLPLLELWAATTPFQALNNVAALVGVSPRPPLTATDAAGSLRLQLMRFLSLVLRMPYLLTILVPLLVFPLLP